LPTDHPRPREQSYRGRQLTFALEATLARQVYDWARQHGVTPFMVCLTAFSVLLSRYSGQDDVVIGIPFAQRDQPGTEHIFGYMLNPLAVRIALSGPPETLLERVKAACYAAYTHGTTPLDQVVEALHLERSLSHSPLFQVMLNYQDFTAARWDMTVLRLQPTRLDRG